MMSTRADGSQSHLSHSSTLNVPKSFLFSCTLDFLAFIMFSGHAFDPGFDQKQMGLNI